MTHNRHLSGLGSGGKSKEHAGHPGGGVKHRSRKRGFKLKDAIPWHFIVGVLAGLVAAWLVLILFVDRYP